MTLLIIAIVTISAVAAFVLFNKQRQTAKTQPAPVTEPVKTKAEPKKKVAAKPVEKKSIVIEKNSTTRKPSKKEK